mmetsp:Transcript_21959/g.29915  ORF Transcript_21959/g.29915 Transcript_21959/m.29915 type:complete len:203 (+) Transcript_21959:949-1557(+)
MRKNHGGRDGRILTSSFFPLLSSTTDARRVGSATVSSGPTSPRLLCSVAKADCRVSFRVCFFSADVPTRLSRRLCSSMSRRQFLAFSTAARAFHSGQEKGKAGFSVEDEEESSVVVCFRIGSATDSSAFCLSGLDFATWPSTPSEDPHSRVRLLSISSVSAFWRLVTSFRSAQTGTITDGFFFFSCPATAAFCSRCLSWYLW